MLLLFRFPPLSNVICSSAYFLMTALEETRDLAASLLPFFRLSPAFNVGEGLIELSSAYWERQVLFSDKSPFDWEVTGRSIALHELSLLLDIVVWLQINESIV